MLFSLCLEETKKITIKISEVKTNNVDKVQKQYTVPMVAPGEVCKSQ